MQTEKRGIFWKSQPQTILSSSYKKECILPRNKILSFLTFAVSDNNRVGHSFESPISRENATPRACSPHKSPYAVSNQGIESEIKESTTGLPSTFEDEEISNQSSMKRQVEQNQSLNSCLGPGLTVKSDSSYGVDSTGKISMDDSFNESCRDSKNQLAEKGFVKDSLIQMGSDGGDCEK